MKFPITNQLRVLLSYGLLYPRKMWLPTRVKGQNLGLAANCAISYRGRHGAGRGGEGCRET